MAKDEQKNESSNQLNLTVVALVALVAIVGLVALVMNAASVKPAKISTGSQLASASNVGGQAVATPDPGTPPGTTYCSAAIYTKAGVVKCCSVGDAVRCYTHDPLTDTWS